MFFLFSLILLTSQVTSAPLSFVELARSNPSALVDVLDTADPNAVNNIIKILQELIQENEKKLLNNKKALEDAEKALSDATLDGNNQATKCNNLQADLDTKITIRQKAKGAHEIAEATRNAREPKLKKEIATLLSVLEKVKSLKATPQQKSRRLLALDSVNLLVQLQEDPESLLQTLTNADPKKRALVIGLIEDLIAAARKELNNVINAEVTAEAAHIKAAADVTDAIALVGTCTKKLAEKEGDIDELKAKRDQAKKFLDEQTILLNHENNQLKQIVGLLTPLTKKE